MKIAFVGIPCSGKTELARTTAKRVNGIFVPEVARVYIDSLKRIPTKEDQIFILKMQAYLENTMPGEMVVCDVPVFLTHLFYRFYHGADEIEKRLYELMKNHTYDIIFRLSALPYKDDGVRYQNKWELEQLDKMLDWYDNKFGKTIYIQTTNLEERIKIVLGEIENEKKNKKKNGN